MKGITSTLTIVILIGVIFTANAQHKALVRHWDFESKTTDLENIINGTSKDVVLEAGINGKGIVLANQSSYLEIKDGVDLMKNFTLSFWFKPNDIESNQTLFYQFRQIPNDLNIRNFIRLEIEKGRFILKSEKGFLGLNSFNLNMNEWYSISYMYDGTNTKLYLQGQLIYSTNESISFYNKTSRTVKNRMFIGRSHTNKSQLNGIVDEIKVFQAAIEETEVAKIFSEHRDNAMVASPPFKEEIEEPTTPPVVEVATTTSSEASSSNQVFDERTKEDEDIVYIDEYKVLDPLVVRTTGITLEYYQIRGDKETAFTIVHNDKSLGKPIVLTKEKQTRRIPLNIGKENSLTFEGFQLKKRQKCKVRVNVKSGRNIIATYDVDLDRNNVVLPIAYLRAKDKNPRNHKIITVNSKNIKIQVKDNSKVDGDVITIKHEGTTILDNYLLTDELKTVDVELKENLKNEFAFVPIDMGKASGENTALVLILVDDKVIYDFSLRSIDVKRPARLTIIHEDF